MNNKNHFEEINDNALGEGVAGGRSCEGEHKAVPLYGIDRPIMPKYGVPENKDDKKDNNGQAQKLPDNALGEAGGGCVPENAEILGLLRDAPVVAYGLPKITDKTFQNYKKSKDDKKDNNGQAQKLPDNTLGGVGGGIGAIEEKPVECFEKEGSDTECKGGKIPPMMLKYGVPPKKH